MHESPAPGNEPTPPDPRRAPLEYQGRAASGDGDNAAWPFVLPMVIFLALVFVGNWREEWHAWAYAARTFIVGGLLIWLWPRLRRDVEWTHLPLGAAVGVFGLVQWVGMDKLLQLVRDQFPDDWRLAGLWNLLISGVRPGEGYDPVSQVLEPAGVIAFVAFVLVRTLGPVLVVPVMEELFWRNWLWRNIISPNNWRLAAIGEPDKIAFIGTCVAFSLVHPQRLVSLVWALLIAWLLVRTRSIGACIVAHAVTNLLLALYVLIATRALGQTSEWYFW